MLQYIYAMWNDKIINLENSQYMFITVDILRSSAIKNGVSPKLINLPTTSLFFCSESFETYSLGYFKA
jgi:hypothetical protein